MVGAEVSACGVSAEVPRPRRRVRIHQNRRFPELQSWSAVNGRQKPRAASKRITPRKHTAPRHGRTWIHTPRTNTDQHRINLETACIDGYNLLNSKRLLPHRLLMVCVPATYGNPEVAAVWSRQKVTTVRRMR